VTRQRSSNHHWHFFLLLSHLFSHHSQEERPAFPVYWTGTCPRLFAHLVLTPYLNSTFLEPSNLSTTKRNARPATSRQTYSAASGHKCQSAPLWQIKSSRT